MQKMQHVAIPRILRAATAVSGGGPASEQSALVEQSIDLLDSPSDEEEKVVIDVESLVSGLLDKPVPIKAEPT